MNNFISRLITEEEGQGMMEYSLIIAVIAIGSLIAWKVLRDKMKAKVEVQATELENS